MKEEKNMEAQALAQAQDGNTLIKTEELKDVLVENRDKHKAELEVALNGWRVEYAAKLEGFLTEAATKSKSFLEDGHRVTLNFRGPSKPADHTKDYDAIIRKMELSQSPTIWLSDSLFEQFVMDNWAWKGKHAEDYANYSRAVGGQR